MRLIEAKDLPKGVAIRDNAKIYIEIMHFGNYYYIPVINKVKKFFDIKRYRGELQIVSDDGLLLEKFIREIINAVYLQVRDTIGEDVYRTLSGEIKEGLEEMYSAKLLKAIESGMEKQTPRQIGLSDAEEEK